MPIKGNKRLMCRHIFIDGRRCGSPSLRDEHFCYYHHKTCGAAALAARQAASAGYSMPLPEDRESIQQSLHQIIGKLVTNELDTRRAGLILYGLQIATQTLGSQPHPDDLSSPVEEITIDPILGDLAPVSECLD